MKKSKANPNRPIKLRKRTEELLNKNPAVIKKLPPRDLRNLLEDLQIYQIELERYNNELQKIHEDLRESEERFRNLTEITSDWIWEVDKNGFYTYVSPKIQDILGYEPEEISGKTPFDLMPPAEANRVSKLFNSIVASQKTFDCLENLNLHKNGHPVVLETSGIPTFDADGEFIGYRGIDRDITERKQAEEALRESKERYRSLAENSMVGFWQITLEGYTTYINPAMCSMIEIEGPEELSGQTYHPFFTTESLEIIEHERTTRPKGKGSSYEVEIIGKNGGRRNVMISGAPLLSAEGKLQSYIATFTDITPRKKFEEALRESEENFRALAENANDGILIAVEDGKLSYANKRATEVTGYSVSELLKMTIRDLAHPDEFEKIIKRYKTIIAGKPFQRQYETMIIRKDGKEVPIEVASAMFTWHGQPADIVIIRDISERKRAEESLRKQTHDLDERVKELNCLYGISKIRERPDIASEEMLQEIVDLIPPSWQYPEITCARIIIEGQEYKTKNFKETVWKQTSNIVVHGKQIGILEICYIEEKPESDEGSFLKEERNLINAITERLGRVTEHKQAEGALRKAHDKLEHRVKERTRDLEIKTKSLEEINIALEVLLRKREEDKIGIEDNVLTNVKELIVPYFEKIKKTKLDNQQESFLSIIESYLNEIISPFTRKMSLKYLNLTPTEIQIANLIRHGSHTKKIAEILNVSPRTVETHRKNIRRKIGLGGKRANLRSHLLSLH